MLFSLIIYDEPDSAALRDQYRQAHLDYLKGFDDQTQFAGPFTSDDEAADLGSLRLIEFADRAAADRHIADEPYVIGGVQKRWLVHRWQPAAPVTWRDCPRTEGNIQALFVGLDAAGNGATRTERQQAHDDYIGQHGDQVIVHGTLFGDDGETPVGNLSLFDAPDMDAARTLRDGDPYYSSGLYDEVIFHRWRFGRVFDRFKV